MSGNCRCQASAPASPGPAAAAQDRREPAVRPLHAAPDSEVLNLVTGLVGRHRHLHDGPCTPGASGGASRRRWLQGITRQQSQFSADAQQRHHAKVGPDGRPRVSGFYRAERRTGDSGALGHLDRSQALRLAQTFEPVAQLKQQLAFEHGSAIQCVHMSRILAKSWTFVHFDSQAARVEKSREAAWTECTPCPARKQPTRRWSEMGRQRGKVGKVWRCLVMFGMSHVIPNVGGYEYPRDRSWIMSIDTEVHSVYSNTRKNRLRASKCQP